MALENIKLLYEPRTKLFNDYSSIASEAKNKQLMEKEFQVCQLAYSQGPNCRGE